MTEQEIITYLKENRNKGVAYAFMPVEVKQWCRKHQDMGIIFNVFTYGEEYGWWRKCDTITCCVNSVYCLDSDYEPKQEFKPHWEELDIDEGGYFEFESKKYYYREDSRFETENRDKFKGFGGWVYEDPISDGKKAELLVTSPRILKPRGLTSCTLFNSKDEVKPVIPIKILFWRYAE